MSEDFCSQFWNLKRYERNTGFVADHGFGAIVLAADASAEQVEVGRDRGLDAQVADAIKLTFKSEFVAVFSNAVLQWIQDVEAVTARVKQTLVLCGLFIGKFGGEGNVARVALGVKRAMAKREVVIAGFWPWCIPSCQDYGARLEWANFKVAHIKLFQRPTPIPGEIDGWLKAFGEIFLNLVAVGDRETLAPDLKDVDGNWSSLRSLALSSLSNMRKLFLVTIAVMTLASTQALADPYDTAILQGLDKVTARVLTIEARLGVTKKIGALEIIVRACDKRPPEETPESAAFVDVWEVRPGEPASNIFRGWMFASSPALSALEHPVYDVWVLDCKNTQETFEEDKG